jgi:hypothetical protein
MTNTNRAADLKTKTVTLAGFTLTLTEGVRYIASRPFADRKGRTYDVTIKPLGFAPEGALTHVEPALFYGQANHLLNAFNDGPMSFDGRVW